MWIVSIAGIAQTINDDGPARLAGACVDGQNLTYGCTSHGSDKTHAPIPFTGRVARFAFVLDKWLSLWTFLDRMRLLAGKWGGLLRK